MAATPTCTSEFLELVVKSGIISEAALSAHDGLPKEPTQCAAVLISKGILTKFQAKLLLNGRYKGFKLGAYFIREQIGQGGMGAVYLAEHETLRRRVALKVLTPPKDGNAGLSVERFLREARSAAALDHSNIVRLHDVGKSGDTHYLVMEYVEGQTLDLMVTKGGPISTSRAVEYIAQAAAGLQHASEKGFVHRDIKPANLMLTKDGTIKILDMGLARPTDEGAEKLTEIMDKGAIVGTADYISPEQAMNGPLDVRSDIYSLGATFYALVTGQPPFNGNTTQKLIQHQMKDAPSVTTLDRTFPPALSAIVSKMLAKKPEQRFQSPGDVIQALADWLPQQAGARVAAGISGTDVSRTGELTTTLSEIASGTRRLGSSPRLNKDRRNWFWPAIAAAVIVVGGSVATAITLAVQPKEQTPLLAKIPPETVGPTTPKPAPVAKKSAKGAVAKVEPAPISVVAPRPVPTPPPRKTPLYKLELAGLPPFNEQGRSILPTEAARTRVWTPSGHTGDGKLPFGWTVNTYVHRSISEVALREFPDGPALGFHTLEGANGTVLASPPFYSTNGQATLRFDFMIEDADGELSVRFAQSVPSKKPGVDLPEPPEHKAGVWQTYSHEFDLKGGSGGAVEFHPRGSSHGFIWIRNLEVLPAGDPAAKPSRDVPLYSVDFKALKNASMVVEPVARNLGRSKIDDQLLPPPLFINQHRPNIKSEYSIADVGGRRCLGLRMIEGDQGVQIQTNCGDAITLASPGETLRIRVVYRYDGTGSGSFGLQQTRAPYGKFQTTPLDPTAGEFRTVELTFLRPADNFPYELIVNCGNQATSPRALGTIYVESMEVSYVDTK